MTPVQICLTVDVEPDCPPFMSTWRGLDEGAPQLLQLLREEDVRTTMFVTGESALRRPDLIIELVADGHELGSHGVTHRRFDALQPACARWEVEESVSILRRFAQVRSFRAPNLSFPVKYLPLLVEAGFQIDSSRAKYKLGESGSSPGLVRIPASATSSVLRLPRWLRDRWLLSLRSPVVLFVHPWEFVDLTGERLRFDCRFRTGRPALDDLRSVIRLFKRQGAHFARMIDLIEP